MLIALTTIILFLLKQYLDAAKNDLELCTSIISQLLELQIFIIWHSHNNIYIKLKQ